MKKLLFLLLLTPLFFIASCEDDPDKYCWTITITTTVTTSSAVEGYPATSSYDTERCDLTESEMKKIAENLNKTTTNTIDGVVYTTTITATYKIKS